MLPPLPPWHLRSESFSLDIEVEISKIKESDSLK
jgi:hypothetical protein